MALSWAAAIGPVLAAADEALHRFSTIGLSRLQRAFRPPRAKCQERQPRPVIGIMWFVSC